MQVRDLFKRLHIVKPFLLHPDTNSFDNANNAAYFCLQSGDTHRARCCYTRARRRKLKIAKLRERELKHRIFTRASILVQAMAEYQMLTELTISNMGIGAADAVAISKFLPKCGALMLLNLSSNNLKAEGSKTVAEAIKGSRAMTSLNLSGNRLGAEGAKHIAEGIKENGALSKFTLSGDYSNSKPVTMETTMTVADFSGKRIGVSGTIMLSAFLPKCTTLSTIIVHKSPLPIQDITTKAELDLSGKEINHLDAIIIAALLPLNRALTSLDISNQVDKYGSGGLGAEGAKYLARALKEHPTLSSLSLASNRIGGYKDTSHPFKYHATPEGLAAIADAMKDMGALTSINLSFNEISVEGAKIVAEAIEVSL
jgi:hypothetical protein